MNPPEQHDLNSAAQELSSALSAGGHRHAFIGGYAASLIGSSRYTQDIDVIVDGPAVDIRTELLAGNGNFILGDDHKLWYRMQKDPSEPVYKDVAIELLQGGLNQQLKLPDVASAPILRLKPEWAESEFPLIHPMVLVMTKVNRWRHIADSTRPKSIRKAASDFEDIFLILQWLVAHEVKIDFTKYGSKPAEELLPGFRLLYAKHSKVRELLREVMEKNDFEVISDSN